MNKLYIGFSASTGSLPLKILGWAIRKFTGGEINHAFLLYHDDNWDTWFTVGANPNGITVIPLKEFLPEHIIKYIFEPTFDLWQGAATLADDLNKKYNYRGLFGMSYVKIMEKLGDSKAHNFLSNKNDLFCSEWIADIIDVALVYFQHTPWTLEYTVDDIIDPTFLCENMKKTPLFSNKTEEILKNMPITY